MFLCIVAATNASEYPPPQVVKDKHNISLDTQQRSQSRTELATASEYTNHSHRLTSFLRIPHSESNASETN